MARAPARLASAAEAIEPDQQLAARVLAGDEEAFASLFHAYRRDAYRVARAVTGDHEGALDALQEAFFKVHQKLSGWRGRSSLRTWVLSIVLRCAIDLRRRWRRRREVAAAAEQDYSYDPRPGLHQAILFARLQGLADRLRGKQGLILRLRLLGGLSNREIAEHLDLQESNVRMQLTRGLARLREML